METHVVLVVGSILLAGGCFGLLFVRLSNPFFHGVGWLGAFFGLGSLAAVAFALVEAWGLGSLLLLADSLILLAFVFLHGCFLELGDSDSRVPWLGIALLIVQVLSFLFFMHAHEARRSSAVTLGLVIAVQASESALLLKRTNKAGMAAPVWFNVVLLVVFATFNIGRSVVIAIIGTPSSLLAPNPLDSAAAIVFLGVIIGLGFGVFWMEGHQIRLDLEHLASIDPLTGIYNRRSFMALCDQELLRSARTGEVFSLIMFDIDHFKKINDRYGHGVGDAVLCSVVEKLRNSVRNIDIVGRWGGEEFVALLPRADAHAALIVGRRLRHHIDSISIPASPSTAAPWIRDGEGNEAIAVTISIGIASYSGRGSIHGIEDLLHECDIAVYQAKAEGRDRIVSKGGELALSK